MLTEFESRLSDVLGARLPAPFGGRVRRRDEAAPSGSGPVIRLGIDAITPLEPDFGSVRPEVVPGSSDQRRVLRFAVTIGIDVEPQSNGGRLQQLLGVDALVYELQDPEMRSAALLVQPGDQGFLLDWLHLADSEFEDTPNLAVLAEGWFWPVGQVGEAGREIERALVREYRLPVHLDVGAQLVAGGAPVDLAVTFGATGTMDISAGGGVGSSPFGSIAFGLLDDGGGPGAGTLSGGGIGPDGTHVISVADGSTVVTYTPPDTALVDHLVVSAHTEDDDGNRHLGIELARFDLVVSS